MRRSVAACRAPSPTAERRARRGGALCAHGRCRAPIAAAVA
ncbi:hypothetical protein BURMUCGD1_1046 [Burkholderia multivorans CGD1]|nr:hypothetical protein BURMUCGD1_1046 [Burkholderia multivorans CGD1]